MLYLRWQETSRRFADSPAIYEGETVLTFGALADLAARAPKAHGPVVAHSGGPTFFIDLLRAWRDGQMAIPVERGASEPHLHRLPPAETVLAKHTPGARGIPRAIFFTATQLMADVERVVTAMNLSPYTPNLAVISLAHSYGFSNIVLPLLLHGVPVHLVPVPFPRPVEEVLARHGPLVVPAVPSIWRAWHRAGILQRETMALAVSAGAPLGLELERGVFAASGLKIHNFYGASECGGIAFDASETPRSSAADLGRPLPGVTVTVDPVTSRFGVESDAVAIGYDGPRSDDQLGEGKYFTRDTGYLDEQGHLQLSGTLAGAINVAGRKVSPAKVEAAAIASGLVTRIRVFGIPSNDAERCEEIAALVELAASNTLETVKMAIAGRLEAWEMPRHWHCQSEPRLWHLGESELRAVFASRS